MFSLKDALEVLGIEIPKGFSEDWPKEPNLQNICQLLLREKLVNPGVELVQNAKALLELAPTSNSQSTTTTMKLDLSGLAQELKGANQPDDLETLLGKISREESPNKRLVLKLRILEELQSSGLTRDQRFIAMSKDGEIDVSISLVAYNKAIQGRDVPPIIEETRIVSLEDYLSQKGEKILADPTNHLREAPQIWLEVKDSLIELVIYATQVMSPPIPATQINSEAVWDKLLEGETPLILHEAERLLDFIKDEEIMRIQSLKYWSPNQTQPFHSNPQAESYPSPRGRNFPSGNPPARFGTRDLEEFIASQSQTTSSSYQSSDHLPREELGPLLNSMKSKIVRVLLKTSDFDSHASLLNNFVGEPIVRWRNSIPNTQQSSKSARVQIVVTHLIDQYDNSGNNALLALLQVLLSKTDRRDSLFREIGMITSRLTQLQAK